MKGIAEGTIVFEEDPDFGYEVATSVPGLEDEEKLRPRLLYERQGRADEYERIVETLKTDRVAHLQRFTQLSEEIIKAVGYPRRRRRLVRAPARQEEAGQERDAARGEERHDHPAVADADLVGDRARPERLGPHLLAESGPARQNQIGEQAPTSPRAPPGTARTARGRAESVESSGRRSQWTALRIGERHADGGRHELEEPFIGRAASAARTSSSLVCSNRRVPAAHRDERPRAGEDDHVVGCLVQRRGDRRRGDRRREDDARRAAVARPPCGGHGGGARRDAVVHQHRGRPSRSSGVAP